MRSKLSKSESNVFRNTLVMSKSHIIQKFSKNVYISPWDTEISQNHLSVLKWSLNKYWCWEVWTPIFQMPCRTHFPKSWMQRSIISNEKVSYLYLGVLPENSWMSFLHCTSHYSLRKSLKDLSDHLNFFVSCQGRSQLSPAIFRASRNHPVASKHSYIC